MKRHFLIIGMILFYCLAITQDVFSSKIVSYSAGEYFTLAIDESGNLWAWGRNSVGQLGDGTDIDKSYPVQIKSRTKFNGAFAAQGSSAFALDIDGNLWAWGRNTGWELGDKTQINKSNPVQIIPGTKFVHVSTSIMHTMAIDVSGNLWAWGDDSSGELGSGTAWSPTPILLNNNRVPRYFNLSLNTVSIEHIEGSQATVSAISNTNWYVSSNQTWLSTNPSVWSNNAILILTATANPSTARTTTM